MQPHDLTTSPAAPSSTPPKAGGYKRYAVSLTLLVAIIAGIAWVVQYLPSRPKTTPTPSTRDDKKPVLAFAFNVAQWGFNDNNPYKEFEPGTTGHYDFLFKNIVDHDIELVYFSTTCDCTSILASALPGDVLAPLEAQQKEKPGEPLVYPQEPQWEELPKDPLKAIQLRVKAKEGGVVRIQWTARKSAGQELNLKPFIWAQPAGEPGGRMGYPLIVPALMTLPVRIYPPRVNVGTLIPGSVVKAEFDAWSSTQDTLDFQLTSAAPDPLFVIETKPMSKEDREVLQKHLQANKIVTRIKAAYHVTVAVHETKDGLQLDLGAFYRRFHVKLDNIVQPDLPGAEVVGRVQGDVVIGGGDDQGKIRFKSFDAGTGASKTVALLADASMQLEPFPRHPHQPTWLNIKLTRDEKKTDGKKRIWHLEVTVPPKTPAARSFDEPDAVVLRIVGAKDRFVRIPLEGHVGGR